ncbi:MAG: hypothetical protein R2864_05515 [Syntrophotaleaceae bacterium]
MVVLGGWGADSYLKGSWFGSFHAALPVNCGGPYVAGEVSARREKAAGAAGGDFTPRKMSGR